MRVFRANLKDLQVIDDSTRSQGDLKKDDARLQRMISPQLVRRWILMDSGAQTPACQSDQRYAWVETECICGTYPCPTSILGHRIITIFLGLGSDSTRCRDMRSRVQKP